MTIHFETIGNATLIIYENNKSLIATDPWFDNDHAYFGSWRLSHKFPTKQREAIEKSKYIFISHFHPDHLNLGSLRQCKKSTILLAQHYGSRVEQELRAFGFMVISLPSRKWISIGKSTRIMLFNNETQDSALLLELTDNVGEKSLILNLNDTTGMGFEKELQSISAKYKNSYLLQLHCWGDADMINYIDIQGNRIKPKCAERPPVGKKIQASMKKFNCNIAIPFSTHHQYQRRDSFWANKYITPVNLMSEGFISNEENLLLPAFQNIEIANGTFLANNINPEKLSITEPIHESTFGDDWNDVLDLRSVNQCVDYFNSISTLFKNYNSISINVGGVDHEMLHDGKGKAKIKFYAPKVSLLKAIRREIFDDLLIGNFMKTKITNAINLYKPDFTMAVAKYSDNGRVKTSDELEKYFNYYTHNRSSDDIKYINSLSLRKKISDLLGEKNVKRIKALLPMKVFKN